MDEKEQLALDLFDHEAVKFGLFTLKNGSKSPIYITLRVLVSYPETLKRIATAMAGMARSLKFDCIAGIAYTGIPIATALSLQTGWPMIHNRKEVKEYGISKALEGVFEKGQTALVIDDLITDGASKFEIIAPLEEAGLKIKDIIVLVDREQGGKQKLAEKGYNLESVLKISELLDILKSQSKIPKEQYDSLKQYFADPAKWLEGK